MTAAFAMKPHKILLVSKFYYRRGGDCIYTLNLEQLLRHKGHQVAVFAMQYPENLPSEWARYWPAQVDFSGGISAKIAAVRRTLGLDEVKRQFCRLLDDFRPDVVHINNIHSYLSPVVAELAHRRGIRVVWTLHDYKLVCPAYSCLRAGSICEQCIGGSKLPVVKTRCMKGSLAASAVAYLEARKWNRRRLQRATDTFICPSSFMASKMQQDGFAPEKLRIISNFITSETASTGNTATAHDYYCYVGRLSAEKGIGTLLQAASKLPYRLTVAGDGPLRKELEKQYAHNPDITFTGQISSDEVHKLLAGARFSVTPSECYENNPLAVIESLCEGTPVIGARAGGIPDLITPKCGITFQSGSVDELSAAIDRAWHTEFDRNLISQTALDQFSPEAYYKSLMEVYCLRAEHDC